jgi:polyhydroxyalkanoate synthase
MADISAVAKTPKRVSRRTRGGSSELGASPWLGGVAPPSALFEQYQLLERSLGATFVPGHTGSVAPATSISAFMDWAMHLAASPAKQWELAHFAAEQWLRGMRILADAGAAGDRVEPLPQDRRFADPQWTRWPFTWLAQAFLLRQQWWERATTGVPGVNPHHEDMVSFAARQWLDMMSPSNSVMANPVVLRRTVEERGANLIRGALHLLQDAWHEAHDLPPPAARAFKVGVDVAATPGRVVMRNPLIELIQYLPTTPTTHPEPVLIVPAWIMKYYILDLSPHNSLVKFLVDRGFTVFAISWKNPDASDRDLGLHDYYHLGVRAALEAIRTIVPRSATHALGYCLGGTLLAMAAAALGREKSKALKSMTLLAAQTDFSDPGEISLFIDESQVAYLENRMWKRGYLDKKQMRHTFQMLRSRDMVWSYRLYNHLLGQRAAMSDVMAWNADGTRLPFRMHSEYLRALYLDNALARGEFEIDGTPINLHDIAVPMFALGAVQDHVAPWRSVFKINHLTSVDQTFVLTAGGHNVGIVNPPGQARTSYRLRHWKAGHQRLTADEWLEATPQTEGSWWDAWLEWLTEHSSRRAKPPRMGAARAGLPPLEPAPGTYVHQQ